MQVTIRTAELFCIILPVVFFFLAFLGLFLFKKESTGQALSVVSIVLVMFYLLGSVTIYFTTYYQFRKLPIEWQELVYNLGGVSNNRNSSYAYDKRMHSVAIYDHWHSLYKNKVSVLNEEQKGIASLLLFDKVSPEAYLKIFGTEIDSNLPLSNYERME